MKAKITRMQFFFMIPNLVFGKAIGITSGVIVRRIGIDTWTSMLIGFFIGVIIAFLLTYMGSKFPEKTIIQYSEEIMGKWIGKIIGLTLTFFFIFAFATSANTMILHVSEYFLPSTPFILVCFVYAVLCAIGVFYGFEAIVRFSVLAFFMAVMITITMILGTLQDFNFLNLKPILDKGLMVNIKNSYYTFSDLAMAIFAITIIYPSLNSKKKSRSIIFWSLMISAFLVVIWPFFEIGVIGSDIMKRYVIVCMEQVRCAQFTKYLPRYELLMVSFFVYTMFIQSTAMFYCGEYAIKQITGIKKDLIIIIPLSIIIFIFTYLLGRDDNNYVNFLAYPWSQICAILSFGLPLLLFFVALFRGKLKKC